MAWKYKVLVILVIAPAFAESFSLPPAKFLKDFAMKYQRSSIVMNLPKEIPHIQVLKRHVISYLLFKPAMGSGGSFNIE